jgi:hypothetical protein
MPGILRSVMTTSGATSSMRSRAACPSAAPQTRYPSELKSFSRPLRALGSSSTTRSRALTVAGSGEGDESRFIGQDRPSDEVPASSRSGASSSGSLMRKTVVHPLAERGRPSVILASAGPLS